MARAATEDPLKIFRFRIEIDGMARAGFTDATGLERDTDVAEYREGGMNETPQKSAGLSKFNDITLRRGQILGSIRGGDNDLIDWADEVHDVADGGSATNYRRDFDIVQFDSENLEICRWRVTQAWPRKIKNMSDLKGTTTDNSYEEIVVAHEGYKKVI